MRACTIRIDPRHERIRDLEMIGMMKVLARFSPHRVSLIVQRDLQHITARIYGLDDNPQPDQGWREGGVRPLLAGMVE